MGKRITEFQKNTKETRYNVLKMPLINTSALEKLPFAQVITFREVRGVVFKRWFGLGK